MANTSRVVLVARLPDDLVVDILFKTSKGVAILASDKAIALLKGKGIAVVELFRSGNDYAAGVANLTREQAIAAVESVQSTALAALTPEERGRFGMA
jgi:hypothetical protein